MLSSILPKNELENSNFCSSLLGQKPFVVRFLEELKKPRRHFEINRPLHILYYGMYLYPSYRFVTKFCDKVLWRFCWRILLTNYDDEFWCWILLTNFGDIPNRRTYVIKRTLICNFLTKYVVLTKLLRYPPRFFDRVDTWSHICMI